MNHKADQLAAFVNGYQGAALWSSYHSYDDNIHLDELADTDDFSEELKKKVNEDCSKFFEDNFNSMIATGKVDFGSHGHDFWMDRNSLGVGFWARGYGDIGRSLSEACKNSGEFHIYLGDDKLIYAE